MSKTTKSILWLAVALVALGALLLPRLDLSGSGAAAGPAPAPEALAVETVTLEPRRLVEAFATVGTIRADEQVELRSEISGVLREILFVEGARVRKGQPLVQIEDAEYRAERDRARHRLELARLREARQQDLLAQGLTSQEEYDLALSQVNVLQAELSLAQAELEKTQIRAPFRGVVGLRSVSRGAALTPQTAIATLQKIDTVKIEFSVPEGQAGRLRVGETITFRVKGTDQPHTGEIYALEPNVDSETRSLRARARCANPEGALLPGAFADVELAINEIEDALTVPAIAVIPELGSKKVFIVENGKATPRLVETGVRTETEVQITRGLAAGDRVIVSAIQQLRSGLPVRATGT